MIEPKRETSLLLLEPWVKDEVEAIFAEMRAEGYDPIAFETYRTQARQEWLYGIGRSHDLGKRPVTWTRNSRHRVRKAVDVISKSRWWSWDEFYDALHRIAHKHRMTPISQEACHIEWNG
jgi:hypothetical protein